MKRNYKRTVIAALMALALLFCSGMSVYAAGSLSDAVEQMREKIGNVITVSVDTKLYSHDDFDREVVISASFTEKDAETEFALLDAKLKSALGKTEMDGTTYFYTDNNGKYTFTLKHASQEELVIFNDILFPGSTISLESDEANIDAFRDSYTIGESLDFSGLCEAFDAKCKSECVYSSFTGIVNDGGGVAEGNTLTITDETFSDAAAPVTVEFTKDIDYTVESISVATDATSTNVVSVAVALDFADNDGYAVGQSASAHFIDYVSNHEDSPYNHYKLQLETREGATAASVEGGETVTDYYLVMRVEGKPDEVTAVIADVFGEGNSMVLSSGSVKESFLFNRNSITHTVDLSALCEDAGCDNSQISYAFSGALGSEVLDLCVDGDYCDVKENSASGLSENTAFTVTIDYRVLSITSLIIAVLAGAAGLCLLAFIVKLIRKRGGKKRAVKRDDVRYEAVKSVALALVPEQQRAASIEVPNELLNRPTVIIKPKSDDGLDDDDDDPEGVILFSMILRILLMVQLVLFFFPYFNVAKSGLLDSVDTITGLDLFLGFKIGDVAIAPNYFSIILFALPLVMLVCLMARNMLPKLALPVALSASSVFAIFYMLNLNSTIYDTLETAINAAATSGSFVSQPDPQLGYDYTLVIYLMLAIGGIVLLLSSIMAQIAQRRQKQEEEMRRFEK